MCVRDNTNPNNINTNTNTTNTTKKQALFHERKV